MSANFADLPIEVWHRIAFDVGGLSPEDVGALRSTSAHFRWMFEATGVDLVKWQALAGPQLCLERKHLDAAARCFAELGHTLCGESIDDKIDESYAAELACANDHVPLLKALLAVGAKPDRYHLNIAASWGNPGVAEVLLDFGVIPNYEAVENASGNGHLEVLKLVLDRGPPDIYLYEGLVDACQNGHEAVVRHLLDRGCDPVHEDPAIAEYEHGDHSPLIKACFRGGVGIVRMLLEAYPDAERIQRSALTNALHGDSSGAVRILLSDPRCVLTPQQIARTKRLCVASKARKCLRALLEDARFDAADFLRAARARWESWFITFPREALAAAEGEGREPWESPLALLYIMLSGEKHLVPFLFRALLLVAELTPDAATQVLRFACSHGRERESSLLVKAGAKATRAVLRAGFEAGHLWPALLPGVDLEAARAAGFDDLVADSIRYNSVIPYLYSRKPARSFDPLAHVLEVAVVRGLYQELEYILERHCGDRIDFALAHVAALAQKHDLPEVAEMVEDF